MSRNSTLPKVTISRASPLNVNDPVDTLGKPCVRVADSFGVGKTHASVSHDGEYLVGQVLFESP